MEDPDELRALRVCVVGKQMVTSHVDSKGDRKLKRIYFQTERRPPGKNGLGWMDSLAVSCIECGFQREQPGFH